MAERLGHIVVGAELQADDLVDLRIAGRDHDDRDIAPQAQLAADLGATHSGHHQVEQHQISTVAIEFGQSGLAIGRLGDVEALPLQHVRQGIAVGLLVLNDQNAGHDVPLVVSGDSVAAAGISS